VAVGVVGFGISSGGLVGQKAPQCKAQPLQTDGQQELKGGVREWNDLQAINQHKQRVTMDTG
jgi:hypothetical protein